MRNVAMLSFVMLSAIVLGVNMLGVMVPFISKGPRRAEGMWSNSGKSKSFLTHEKEKTEKRSCQREEVNVFLIFDTKCNKIELNSFDNRLRTNKNSFENEKLINFVIIFWTDKNTLLVWRSKCFSCFYTKLNCTVLITE